MTALLTFISGAALAATSNADCSDRKNTTDITNCMIEKLDAKEVKLRKYLAAAQKQEKQTGGNDEELIETQKIWENYMRKHCGYLYSRQPGSARYTESAECQLRLYDERIKEIWLAYLTYSDSTPPVLPEPKD